MSCVASFQKMCRRIVSPTRHPINERDFIKRKFRTNNIPYETFQIRNSQMQKLSLIVFPKDFRNLPTVLYLHGNGGHKLEALQLADFPINLIAFDFSACGKSQGSMLTYGEKEVRDIEAVLKFIKQKYQQPQLTMAIWGRSMGASIALMYASLHQIQIYALVLDSPFSNLKKVVSNVAKHNSKNTLPQFLINIALYFVQNKVNEISDSDVFSNDYSMHLNLIGKIPVIFAFSTSDNVVTEEDVRELYQAYRGPKNLVELAVEHHADRPKDFIQFGMQFVQRGKNQFEMQKEQQQHMLKIQNSKKGISLSNRKTQRR